MSLGLPEFGSRDVVDQGASLWRGVRLVGLAVLAYVLWMGAIEWQAAARSRASLDKAKAETARMRKSVEEGRRALLKSTEMLVATASVESPPDRVLNDLNRLLPRGVFLPDVKIDYTEEGTVRISLTVVAPTSEAYDQFLQGLSESSSFAEIMPGAETRPGVVRATLTALHRSGAVGR